LAGAEAVFDKFHVLQQWQQRARRGAPPEILPSRTRDAETWSRQAVAVVAPVEERARVQTR
jgi:hypothetical protein